MITDQKSLEESAVERIENPVVVTPPLQDERMSRNEDSCSSWFRKIQSSHTVSTQKAIRVLAALCALGLLGGVTISVWFMVKLLLKPTSNSTTALEHAKETSFCNISDDSSVADPRKVFYRISAENSLLEIQLDKLQTWLPVCYKRWNSSLGTLVCRQLGHLRWEKLTARSHTLLAISSIHLSGSWASYLWARHRITDKYTHKIYFTFKTGTAAAKELVWVREDESASRLTKYKGVNLTDIEHSYTDGFVQITAEHQSKLESVWQFRGNCSIGKIIALKCFDCGTRAKVPRIIGGVDATLGRWPWQVSLYYNNRHTCGGSIITSQWIITAAHCVATYRLHQASSWVVYAGIVTRNAAKLAQYVGYTVEKIIYNKNYNHRSHDSDIALMKLRNPLNFSDTIRPVCLPQHDHELPAGTLCWISGWGYTQPDEGHIPDTLKEAQVTLISTKKCNSSCMYHGEITARMLCAGHTEGNTDACQGDSGGPLVCQDDHVWRLVGVVSWGTGCAQPNHPGVYTKVAEFLGWIYEILETS